MSRRTKTPDLEAVIEARPTSHRVPLGAALAIAAANEATNFPTPPAVQAVIDAATPEEIAAATAPSEPPSQGGDDQKQDS